MMDSELRSLLNRPPDRSLDALQAHIWAGVSERQRQARIARRLIALQSVVLVGVLAASLGAGAHIRRASGPEPLDVFSPRMTLSISTRLAGIAP